MNPPVYRKAKTSRHRPWHYLIMESDSSSRSIYLNRSSQPFFILKKEVPELLAFIHQAMKDDNQTPR